MFTDLSKRGAKALEPAMEYLGVVISLMDQMYDASDNKNGYISLAVAENVRIFPRLRDYIHSFRIENILPDSAAVYDCNRGKQEFREAIVDFLSRLYAHRSLDPACVCASVGLGAVVSTLTQLLTDPGDSVIIPSPYYAAFENDVSVLAGATAVAAYCRPPDYEVTREVLDTAYDLSISRGSTPRLLLISSPVNPMGKLYTAKDLGLMHDWATSKGMHFVVDEIYAGSVFEGSFLSALELFGSEEKDLPDNVHVLFGFSKDFGISGFRVGYLYTCNRSVLQAWENVGYFCSIPSDTQHALSAVLRDKDFITDFFAESRVILKKEFVYVRDVLLTFGVKCFPASAALFCWMDLRPFLDENTFEGEARLWKDMIQKARVILIPGRECRCCVPGFFRLCFTAVSRDVLDVSLDRLRVYLEQRTASLGQNV